VCNRFELTKDFIKISFVQFLLQYKPDVETSAVVIVYQCQQSMTSFTTHNMAWCDPMLSGRSTRLSSLPTVLVDLDWNIHHQSPWHSCHGWIQHWRSFRVWVRGAIINLEML